MTLNTRPGSYKKNMPIAGPSWALAKPILDTGGLINKCDEYDIHQR